MRNMAVRNRCKDGKRTLRPDKGHPVHFHGPFVQIPVTVAIERFEWGDNSGGDTSLVHNAVERERIAFKMDAPISGLNIGSS